MSDVLELQQITKSYGGRTVLDAVNLKLPAGELMLVSHIFLTSKCPIDKH